MKRKEVKAFVGCVACMAASTLVFWNLTDWEIGKVLIGAVSATMVIPGLVCAGRDILKSYIAIQKRKTRLARMRKEALRRRRAKIYDLSGELVEIPTSDPQIKEIRYVLDAQKNILPPTKAMQDVG